MGDIQNISLGKFTVSWCSGSSNVVSVSSSDFSQNQSLHEAPTTVDVVSPRIVEPMRRPSSLCVCLCSVLEHRSCRGDCCLYIHDIVFGETQIMHKTIRTVYVFAEGASSSMHSVACTRSRSMGFCCSCMKPNIFKGYGCLGVSWRSNHLVNGEWVSSDVRLTVLEEKGVSTSLLDILWRPSYMGLASSMAWEAKKFKCQGCFRICQCLPVNACTQNYKQIGYRTHRYSKQTIQKTKTNVHVGSLEG